MDPFDRYGLCIALVLIAVISVVDLCRSYENKAALAARAEINDSLLERLIVLEEQLHSRTMELKNTIEDNGIFPLVPPQKTTNRR